MLQLWNGRVLVKQLTDCLHERSMTEKESHKAGCRAALTARTHAVQFWLAFHNTFTTQLVLTGSDVDEGLQLPTWCPRSPSTRSGSGHSP